MKIGKVLLMVVSLIAILTACKNSNDALKTEKMMRSDIQYDKQKIAEGVKLLTETGEKTEIFTEDFVFPEEEVMGKQVFNNEYFFDSAYYIQVGISMYRFQLNEQGLIESYIIYNYSA